MAAEEKFTWRIGNFSTFTEPEIFSNTFSIKGHQCSHIAFKDATLRDISDIIPRTKEELQRINGIGKNTIAKYGDRLILTIESAISNYYEEEGSGSKCNNTNDSAKMKREFAAIEPCKAINSLANPLPTKNKVAQMSTTTSPSKAINSLTEPLSTKNKVAQTRTITSPCSSNVRTASKNLIAKLSTMPSCQKTTPVDDVQVSTNDGSALLLEQKGKLSEFFEMSLEAIWQANSFDSVRELVRKFSEIASDPFEKRMLKDLLSRLVEFNCSTPKSLSVIESSAAIETSNIQAKKQIEASLLERQNQLKVLDSEVSRIEEDQLKLDAEYKQLLSRRCKLGHEKNLAIAEMEAANREASRELVELEKKQAEHERARDDLRRAKEKLAQNNASWKFFKDNLAL
ncbi:ATP-dependent DNA helicase Q-like 4B [Linum grandiflorum]